MLKTSFQHGDFVLLTDIVEFANQKSKSPESVLDAIGNVAIAHGVNRLPSNSWAHLSDMGAKGIAVDKDALYAIYNHVSMRVPITKWLPFNGLNEQ